MHLKLLTLNTRGFRNRVKQNQVIELAKFLGANILLIQESHLSKRSEVVSFEEIFKVKSFWSFGSHNSRGVGIIFLKDSNIKVLKWERDTEGRVIKVSFKLNGEQITVLSVYGPNKSEESYSFYKEELPKFLIGGQAYIMGGDYNCILNKNTDSSSKRHSNSRGAKELRYLLECKQMSDQWDESGGDRGFTRLHKGYGNRLDRLYATPSLTAKKEKITVIETLGITDHKAVLLTLRGIGCPGPQVAPWRMNVSLLEQNDIHAEIKHIVSGRPQGGQGWAVWWENAKQKIKECLRRHGKVTARSKMNEVQALQTHLRALERGASTMAGVSKKEAQDHLRLLWEERWASVRQRQAKEKFENESWCSRRLLFKEATNARLPMEALVSSDGTRLTTSETMAEEARHFFQQLYKGEVPMGKEHPAPSPAHLRVSPDEVRAAIAQLQNKKAPGPDGLVNGFYKKFVNTLGPALANVFNEGLERGDFGEKFNEGQIILICKDENKREHLEAWRPITLLNADLKILSRILVNRLSKKTEELITSFQGAGVPGRNIQRKNTEIRDIITLAADRQVGGILLSIDQKNAFDRVRHDFLFEELKNKGIDRELISAISTLYRNPSSSVLINGALSEKIKIQTGVRQGCPLSPLLYVVAFDSLLKRINGNNKIDSFPFPTKGNDKLIVAYADDLSVFLKNEKSVVETVKTIEEWGQFSGAQINKQKSACLYLGGLKKGEDTQIPVKEEIKVLGVRYHAKGFSGTNWTLKIKDSQHALNQLQTTDLSLFTRTKIVKTIVIPKWTYLFGIEIPSKKIITSLRKMIFHFIWNGRTQWVKQEKLMLTKSKGGLDVPELNALAKAHLIRGIYNSLEGTGTGKEIAKFWLGYQLRAFIPGRIENSAAKSAHLPWFYKNAKDCIKELRTKNPDPEYASFKARDFYRALRDEDEENAVSKICPQAWERINYFWLDDSRKTLLWKIGHDVLPVRAKFFAWKKSSDADCVACHAPETVRHAIFDCMAIARIWDSVRKFFNLNSLSYEEATGHHLVRLNKRDRKFFALVAAETAYQGWVNRCRIVHGAEAWGENTIKAKIGFYVKLWLGREKLRLGDELFAKTWQSKNFKIVHDLIRFKLH